MGGKKGRSGRKRKYNDPGHEAVRKFMLDYYYKHREERKKAMQEYHKKNKEIMKYAAKHGISIPEARRRLKKGT